MCFYALCYLSNHIALHNKVIFRWLCSPQVVQKQTLDKVKKTECSFNGKFCQEYFVLVLKIIKI